MGRDEYGMATGCTLTLDPFSSTDRLIGGDIAINGHKVHQAIQGLCSLGVLGNQGLTVSTPRGKKFQYGDTLWEGEDEDEWDLEILVLGSKARERRIKTGLTGLFFT